MASCCKVVYCKSFMETFGEANYFSLHYFGGEELLEKGLRVLFCHLKLTKAHCCHHFVHISFLQIKLLLSEAGSFWYLTISLIAFTISVS